MKKIDWKNRDWLNVFTRTSNRAMLMLVSVMAGLSWMASLHYVVVSAGLTDYGLMMVKVWAFLGLAWVVYVVLATIKNRRDRKNPNKRNLNKWFAEFVLDDCRLEAKIALKKLLEDEFK